MSSLSTTQRRRLQYVNVLTQYVTLTTVYHRQRPLSKVTPLTYSTFPWTILQIPTSSMNTSQNLWKRFVIPLGGGGIIALVIQSCRRWRSTISASLVSHR